jgi:hypothetical protein
VVPLASGAVQLEWVIGDRALELEFETPATIHYLRWDPRTNIADEQDLPITDVARVETLMRWFTHLDA